MRGMQKAVIAIAVCAALGLGIGSSYAYMTDQGDAYDNTFSGANVDITIVEQFAPPQTMQAEDVTYEKLVCFQNEGTTSAYTRVQLAFSDENVSEISYLSHDGGKSWFPADELPQNLPDGWHYAVDGLLSGYYYYETPLEVGDVTDPLITNVKTCFIEKTADTNETINHTPRDYDIYVYAEGLQQMRMDGSALHTDYQKAWIEFLQKKGENGN